MLNAKPEWADQFDMVLEIAARHMLKGADADALTRWAVEALPYLLTPHEDQPPEPGIQQAVRDPAFCALLGRAIHAAMPLPERRFRPLKLAWPQRNDPCLCGSGRKFKLCCGPMAANMPPIVPEMCAGPMLRAMGRSSWSQLPAQGMPIALVIGVADAWREDLSWEDAARLLEPWLPKEGLIADELAELLDLLSDIYADLDNPRKRKALAQSMIDRGGRLVQAKGWQRLALMNCDAGKHQAARHAMEQAMRLNPQDVALSILELSLLIGEGREEALRDRADFWARQLRRRYPRGEHDALIEAILDMGERGAEMMTDTAVRHAPELQALADCLAAWPKPYLALRFGKDANRDLGKLTPDEHLAPALKTWHRLYQQALPDLISLRAPQGPDATAWLDMTQWLPLLSDQPVLGSSFDVLDALVLLLDGHPSPAGVELADRFVARAMALWALIRAAHPHAMCEWGYLANRPALRLIARFIVSDDTPQADRCFDWLRHLVEVLNPNDNHGFRRRLMAVYLRKGMLQEALALSDRYPDDFHAMQMLRARTLWALDRPSEAQALVRNVFADQPHFAKVWRTTRLPAERRLDAIRYGSLEEAQIAYRDQHDLWQGTPLRAWLKTC